MFKHTPLYGLHLELNAKMVEFAGYRMPLYYGKGTLQEHLHCRNYAGFFDISHMGQFQIAGNGAALGLETLTPGNLADLKPWRQKYTVLTNPAGGIIDDIIVTRMDSGLLLIANAACKAKVYEHLKQHLPGHCALKELPEQALFALQGPKAADVLQKFVPQATTLSFMQARNFNIFNLPCIISRSGYTGEDGFEISIANPHAETIARLLLGELDVAPIGLAARDTLRLEAGLCLYGHELSETISPAGAGLHWIFKAGHTEFPGAAKILPELAQGSPEVRTGLIVEGKIPVRQGAILYAEQDKQAGYVTSGGFSPCLGKPIAMAYLARNYASPGSVLFTKVREHSIKVEVVTLPFIPHRYRR